MPTFNGTEVGPIGLGLMSLTGFPSSPPTEKAIEVLKAALNKGVNCWNGAEFYGQEENSMTLLRAYFNKYPEDADKVTIVIKGGVDTETRKANGSPEFIRKSIDNILTQLGGKKKLDVFCIARRDARVDFGETLNLIQKEYVETGKVGAIAISECAAKTIHEAVKHVKIVAVEVELSMVSPDILKNGVADAAGQYGIPIIAYSPMGRGLLTGRFNDVEDVKKEKGMLSIMPRFQPGAFEHNIKIADQVQALAAKKGCTPAQLGINWSKKQGDLPGRAIVIPIPGASTVARVEENCTVVELTDEELKEINAAVDSFEVKGDRYPAFIESNT